MREARLDAMLLTTEANFRYFTGFQSLFWESPTRPWFVVVPLRGKPIAVIPEIGLVGLEATWVDEIKTWPSPRPEDDGVSLQAVPNDMGTQWRSGTRFGPRAIREASTLFSFGHGGAYEDDITYLTNEQVRIVDIGDADIVHTDMNSSHANTEMAVRKILQLGAIPLVLGGNHSISYPCIKAFAQHGSPIHVVQFDAHAGSDILSVRQIRTMGKEAVLERIPAGVDYYVTIDIDGFDVSIAPGTGSPVMADCSTTKC